MLFTEHYAKLPLALFDNFSFILLMPSQNFLYVNSKQINSFQYLVEEILLALRNKIINARNTIIERHQNRFVATIALIYKDHFIRK